MPLPAEWLDGLDEAPAAGLMAGLIAAFAFDSCGCSSR